jgi:hypothetical protein
VQNVVNGYPLAIEAERVETREVEFNAGAGCGQPPCMCIGHKSSRLARAACRVFAAHSPQAGVGRAAGRGGAHPAAALSAGRPHSLAALPLQAGLGLAGLPEEVSPEMLESDTFLKAFHHVLLEACVCVCWQPPAASCGSRTHAPSGARGRGCADMPGVRPPVCH